MSNSNIFNFNIDWEGFDDTLKNYDLYDQKVAEAATHAMVENTEALLGKSMRIVPHDEGMLEGSGSAKVQNVEVAHGSDDGNMIRTEGSIPAHPGAVINGTVSYNEPYAARQHEELGYRHKEGRQAKYLEMPLKEFVRQFAQNIANAVKGVRR